MGMLKEGVRLDRVRGGRQKYRNRMRIVGQASINRAEAYGGNIDGRRENDQGYHMSSVPYPTGGEEKIPVIKTSSIQKYGSYCDTCKILFMVGILVTYPPPTQYLG